MTTFIVLLQIRELQLREGKSLVLVPTVDQQNDIRTPESFKIYSISYFSPVFYILL